MSTTKIITAAREAMEIEVGKTYEAVCPFVLEPYTEYDEGGARTSLTWRPGVKWEPVYPDSSEPVAHGVGKVFYSVVSVHKLPSPYPARIFYTRKFETPDARTFGKSRLHVTTAQAFARRLRSYKPGGVDQMDDIVLVTLSDAEKQQLLEAE